MFHTAYDLLSVPELCPFFIFARDTDWVTSLESVHSAYTVNNQTKNRNTIFLAVVAFASNVLIPDRGSREKENDSAGELKESPLKYVLITIAYIRVD